MCGICGFYGSSEGERWMLLDRMCQRIIHRGPDDQGIYTDDFVGLGMRRLSIIDLEGGSQPVFNEDESVCVVFNGEIYNFQELRDSLEAKGHKFASRSDTEVIVHLYEDYGPSFVEHLNGMFAIALWDLKRRSLVLVRDRLGVKPLFYAPTRDGVVFGSEIKCLLEHPAVTRTLDLQALYHYFVLGYVPQPRTIYSDVRKLAPGALLIVENESIKTQQYWSPPKEIDASFSKADAIDRLRALMADAVAIRMISDVPLGAFLSGGVDSSITVAQMAKTSTRPIKTFFIDFDDTKFSERDYARAVARRYATDHHEFTVKPSALEVLDDLVNSFDEPFADSSAIPTYYVSKLARQHVTVILSGDGGDESFGGYNRYRQILKRHELPGLRRFLRPFTDGIESVLPRTMPGRRRLRSVGKPNREYYVLGTQEDDAQRFLTRNVLAVLQKDVLRELTESAAMVWQSNDRLLPFSRFDLQWYLPDDVLTKVDRMSMAHSLEVRSPFLDYRIVEFAARLSAEMKIVGENTKVILKEAFAADLPPKILEPRKRGFSVPMSSWLRNELREPLFDIINDPELENSGFLNMSEIRKLACEHQDQVRDRHSQLWRVIYFAHWWRTNQRPAPAQASVSLRKG